MSGRLEAIWLKRGKGAPMDAAPSASARTGVGLVGNGNAGGRRQVTVIAAEAWRRVEEELDRSLDPRLRRANLMVSGIDLAESRDRVLVIGAVKILIRGETTPCRLMEETLPGLKAALTPDWRGGAYGEVLSDGEIRVGDGVEWQ